ncbi:16S rRNA (cytidine(1402)-2'-O)-methyltransferase [Gemella sp. zg-1178]|uniref:16S rRNA (cytidine(1402)-2'-O)-methyltransferase n=1 Tax=Gemella sp. zg-1178 TaxID=2840372 RepID=UPI001C058959|nr:16S rRNA (cytidine(1402)-2'-O)-methyltransferase [Gemella sp. zg-1178]MBU0278554.1 16S rRNA (cytidine(1402)-2'-O)-methyltransferase [Gemella sp. zg-1178]
MLYLVSTPIGNLDDISIRALKVLEESDIIACEDTRNTKKLLNHFNIKNKKLISYHEHNEEVASDRILGLLKDGASISLVSDAGMPCVSDPGYILIKKCKENLVDVVAIPGANAGLTALIASGIESYNYVFHGFLPRKSGDLKKKLTSILNEGYTAIIYESPHRIKNLVEHIVDFEEDRIISVARELTKIYEQVVTDKAINILNFLNSNTIKEKGEFVLIISPNKKNEEKVEIENLLFEIEKLVESGIKVSEALKIVSKKYGVNKREVYKLYHEKYT